MKDKLMCLVIMGLFSILHISMSYAQGAPHQFYGTVTTNGIQAPDGLTITAKINDAVVAETSTLSGTYGLGPPDDRIWYIADLEGIYHGEIIEFFLNDIKVAEYVFDTGNSTGIDFSVTGDLGVCGDGYPSSSESCESCPADHGACPSNPPAGPSPPPGGVFAPPTQTQPCEEAWSCSAWSICSSTGKQLRTCVDLNNCGTEENKSAEEKSCTYTPPQDLSICDAGSRKCSEERIVECVDGKFWNITERCEHGCDSGTIQCNPAPGTTPDTGTETTTTEGTGGITGAFLDSPAAIFGVLFLLILILIAAMYLKVRK